MYYLLKLKCNEPVLARMSIWLGNIRSGRPVKKYFLRGLVVCYYRRRYNTLVCEDINKVKSPLKSTKWYFVSPLQTSQSGCIIIESSGKSCFYSIFNFPHKEREYPIYAANKHSNQKATQLINWIHSCITIMITGKNQHHIACRLCTNMYHQIHCFPLLWPIS